MRAVSEISRSVNVGDPVETVLARIADLARELIGFDLSAVMLVDEAAGRLDVIGWSGLSDDYVDRMRNAGFLQIRPATPDTDSPAARAFRDAETITISDVTRESETYGSLDFAPMQGYRSLVAAPLRGTDGPIGVLVGYSTAPRSYGAADIELTELLAEQTATAIHTARYRAGRDWAEQQHRTLMHLVLAEAGMDRLVDALAEILSASVTVADLDGRILASSEESASGSLPQQLAEHRPKADLRPTNVTEHFSLADTEGWVTPVVIGGEVAARLWIVGDQAVSDSARQRLVEQFALVTGIEMLTARHALEIEERLSGDLLSDVLRGGALARQRILLERGNALGFSLEDARNVVVVRANRIGAQVPDVSRRVQRAVRTKILASSDGDDTVMLLPEIRGLRAALDCVHHQIDEDSTSTISIVIGPPVHGLEDIQPAYRAAKGAAQLRANTGLVGLLDLRDLSVVGLMLMAEAPPAYLHRLADQLIAPLADQDARRNSQLVDTLRAWLRSGFSTAQAAAALMVHVNTVGQRLVRIEKLVERDFKLADTRLDLQLALHVWDVLHIDPG
ncbi:helix-turn-helix domain-containing protein [Amycolatopsis ultiminotia]|uniref:Helix-turn-helix domain-containing protein n=1 Tax=Amycolatopsis ultiminotia TaxID=543629 RepID=A0ABP6VY91_9PSEU